MGSAPVWKRLPWLAPGNRHNKGLEELAIFTPTWHSVSEGIELLYEEEVEDAVPILPIGRGEGTPGAHGVGRSMLALSGQVCRSGGQRL